MMLDVDKRYFDTVEKTEQKHVGSTCVFAVVQPPKKTKPFLDFNWDPDQYKIDVTNVGDSRCVVYRYADGKEEQITKDHKPDDPKELARIEKAGGFVAEGRVDGKLAMSRSIGDWGGKKDLERTPENQKVTAVPDFEQRVARRGDFMLVACDGFFEKLTSERVMQIIKESLEAKLDPCEAIVKLMDESLTAGSTDNMTAVLVLFQDGREYHQQNPQFLPGKMFVEDK
jgi:serine/threonine protein phosphatase PrpC